MDALPFAIAYAAIAGYSVEELLSFLNTRSLILADDQDAALSRYQERLAGKPEQPPYEYRLVQKDVGSMIESISAMILTAPFRVFPRSSFSIVTKWYWWSSACNAYASISVEQGLVRKRNMLPRYTASMAA